MKLKKLWLPFHCFYRACQPSCDVFNTLYISEFYVYVRWGIGFTSNTRLDSMVCLYTYLIYLLINFYVQSRHAYVGKRLRLQPNIELYSSHKSTTTDIIVRSTMCIILFNFIGIKTHDSIVTLSNVRFIKIIRFFVLFNQSRATVQTSQLSVPS